MNHRAVARRGDRHFRLVHADAEPSSRTDILPPTNSAVGTAEHSLVTGPVSGKTTLLKMLQGSALERWRHPEARRIRRAIDYTGIFIASDIAWRAQMEQLGGGRLDHATAELVGQGVFTTHVLRSLVDAMEYRLHGPDGEHIEPHRRVAFDHTAEASLVAFASRAWQLPVTVPTLRGLRQELSIRLSGMPTLAATEAARGMTGRAERLAGLQFLYLDFFVATSAVVDEFDGLAGQAPLGVAIRRARLGAAPHTEPASRITAERRREADLNYPSAHSATTCLSSPKLPPQWSGKISNSST